MDELFTLKHEKVTDNEAEVFFFLGSEQNVHFFIHKQSFPEKYTHEIAYNLFNCMVVYNRIPRNDAGYSCRIVVYDIDDSKTSRPITAHFIQHILTKQPAFVSEKVRKKNSF